MVVRGDGVIDVTTQTQETGLFPVGTGAGLSNASERTKSLEAAPGEPADAGMKRCVQGQQGTGHRVLFTVGSAREGD